MSRKSLRVIARINARMDKEQELRDLLLGLVSLTRKEHGCISYELVENKVDPSEFVFIEEWEDEAALEAHFKANHIQQALKQFPALLTAELDIRRYQVVE